MRLLGSENVGGRVEHWWLHSGDDGTDRITVQTVQDAEPVIESVQMKTELNAGDFRFKASIPETIVDECCRVYGLRWGVTPTAVMQELMSAKTSRSKRIWKMLTEGRDYRKLQAKKWR